VTARRTLSASRPLPPPAGREALDQPSQRHQRCRQTQNCHYEKYFRLGWHLWERDFYSNKASALEEENRELTESATKYSLHAQKLSANSPRRRPSTPCGAKGWNANSTGLIQMVRPTAGSERKAKIGLHHTKEMDVF